MEEFPTGTVTFLFTDVEGSTRLWEAHRAAMGAALGRHDAILHTAIADAGGRVFATGGDGVCAAFASAGDAVAAAIAAQRELAAEPWPDDVTLRVRMGLHTGEVQERDDNYFGPAVNRAARLMGAAHGGQIVVSSLTAELLDVDAVGVSLVDLGPVELKGLTDPVHAYGVTAPDVPWVDRALSSAPGSDGTPDVGPVTAAPSAIRTPDQRLRVFVSSTLGELAPERAAVRSAIERLRLIPVMFELGARPHPPAQLYRAYLEQSQVFLGVYWERYGWVAPGETISGLEDEFVLSEGMPRLMYIKEPAEGRETRLAEMIGRLGERPDSSYRRFETDEELAELVEQDLAVLLSERFEQGGPARPVAGRTARSAPPPLPVPLTPTIGRASVVDAVAEEIRSGARLVTITGTGGVGKTRVATEVARALQDDFEEVRVVRIGDVVDPALVTATIAVAVGVPVEMQQTAVDAVAAALGDDRVLLVLDNLEQVVGAGPELALLLERCPGLSLLVTSRQVLRLQGEHEIPLAPLDLPDQGSDDDAETLDHVASSPAVALFVEHAMAARPSFRLDPSNVRAVAELCRRLDGLPLAIELVAARIRLLPPEAILERLGDRIDVLDSGSVNLPDRQRTLRATLDWSYRLLEADEQALFARLAVFAGGASLDAIEFVCHGEPVDDVLETLSSLLEKSLVVTFHDADVGPRIAMLQTVRAYAWRHLEEAAELVEVRDRHATWFQELAARCDPARHPGATERWAELDREVANVRAAIAWRTEQDDDAALGSIAASSWIWYWLTGRMSEGRVWIERLASRVRPPDRVEPAVAASIWEALGAVRFSLGDHLEAEVLLRHALAAYGAADDAPGAAVASCMLALIVPANGDVAEAIDLATSAATSARSRELDWGLSFALAVLGGAIRRYSTPERGIEIQLEALEIAQQLDEPVLLGQLSCQLALDFLSEGDVAGAEPHLVRAARCCRRTHQVEGTVLTLEVAAAIAFVDGRPRDAAVLVGAANRLRERVEIPVWPVMQRRRTELLAALAEQVGPDDFEVAFAEGRLAEPFSLLPT
ncbi:MAG: DUF4062 domain-containing protein [Actinobacteria bacterium]|nr:DUF4062 domain-containing protein [Actinomycetota bacterium]